MKNQNDSIASCLYSIFLHSSTRSKGTNRILKLTLMLQWFLRITEFNERSSPIRENANILIIMGGEANIWEHPLDPLMIILLLSKSGGAGLVGSHTRHWPGNPPPPHLSEHCFVSQTRQAFCFVKLLNTLPTLVLCKWLVNRVFHEHTESTKMTILASQALPHENKKNPATKCYPTEHLTHYISHSGLMLFSLSHWGKCYLAELRSHVVMLY